MPGFVLLFAHTNVHVKNIFAITSRDGARCNKRTGRRVALLWLAVYIRGLIVDILDAERMPRVVADQKAKFESDELFKKLSQEVDVS